MSRDAGPAHLSCSPVSARVRPLLVVANLSRLPKRARRAVPRFITHAEPSLTSLPLSLMSMRLVSGPRELPEFAGCEPPKIRKRVL